MLSFSKRIKDDLLMLPVPPYCCSSAELCAYIMLLGKFNNGFVDITVEDKFLSDRISALCFKVLKQSGEPLKLRGGYSIILENKGKTKEKYGFLFSEKKDEEPFDFKLDNIYKKSCCIAAFLRGAFIASGTLMNPEKSYNLEISAKNKKTAQAVSALAFKLGVELKTAVRKGRAVLYVKNSDTICDVLTYIGAHNAQMEILNLKIERELRSDLNRSSNGEIANMDKTIKASISHIAAIEKIENKMGLDALGEELCETARLRKEHRDLSIDALAKKHSTPISKSGVNHRLKKIIKIAEGL